MKVRRKEKWGHFAEIWTERTIILLSIKVTDMVQRSSLDLGKPTSLEPSVVSVLSVTRTVADLLHTCWGAPSARVWVCKYRPQGATPQQRPPAEGPVIGSALAPDLNRSCS